MFTIKPRVAATVATPDTGEKTLFLDQSDSILKTKDDAGVVEALATTDTVQDALDAQAATEPKVYVALLTQDGTDAPVAIVLKNTLGGVPVWTRGGVGSYKATLANTFTLNKTFSVFTIGGSVSSVDSFKIFDNLNDDFVDVQIFTDGVLTDIETEDSPCKIKIEVYP